MPEPLLPDYRQHVELETPEHVLLDYEVAGVGSRALAAMIDWIIVVVIMFVCAVVSLALRSLGSWAVALSIVMTFIVGLGYFALFETFNHGQTPGKRNLGIRVIGDTGHGVTFAEAAARNLLLPIDMIGFVGLILIAVDGKGRRLGDHVAGTLVVRDRPVVAPTFAAVASAALDHAGAPELSDDEFHLLHQFVARAQSLPPPVRDRFAHQLAARFAALRPPRAVADVEFVTALHDADAARRAGRYGARGGGAPARGTGSAIADRLVARKQSRWNAFQLMADRVTAHGLDALSAAELPDFAARYREIAADLARARTYHADPRVIVALERLVAAGHNALYRAHPHTGRRIWQFIAGECPGAVVAARRYVALAIAVLALPALAGYTLMRAHPELAPRLLPDTMLERADAGAARQQQHLGFVETTSADRPVLAAAIITNNVRVAFNCFASGIALGVGSLVMLAYNGLQLGAISGYFEDRHLLGYLWTFVIGHSLLELFAICVAGAAGFLLGRAVIAPGDLPRRDALAVAGRRAVRMVGATVVLLLFAGTIEGFISASGSTVTARLAVSGVSLVFLTAYLWRGARYMRANPVLLPG